MIIEQIELKNYRNYSDAKIKFKKNINIIIGNNAQGKTNILEAIYFLSLTKSYRANDDSFLIKNGCDSAIISGKIKDNNLRKKIKIILSKNNKRLFLNDNLVKKVSDYIGILNVIMISPEDINIIKGSPSDRRNFINIELSKMSGKYLNTLNEYNKILKMRNDYLKLIFYNNVADTRYLDILTNNLIDRAAYLIKEKSEFFNGINKYLNEIFYDIAEFEDLSIKYNPNFEIDKFEIDVIKESLKKKIKENESKEIKLGMSLYGPHRDDFEFICNKENIKWTASQGQQKLAIIALKISLLNLFEEIKKQKPILLLDDIFSELDKKRKNKLIKYVNDAGQVIITTNDIKDINKKKITNAKVFEIKKQKIIEKGDINGK